MTDKQQKIAAFLEDLRNTLRTSQIKSINPILKRNIIEASIGTVCKLMNVFVKMDGYLMWNDDFIDLNNLAIEIDENNKQYHQIQSKLPAIKGYMQTDEETERFPVPFKEVWQFLGYSAARKAKEILFQYFTENIDYYTVALEGLGENENTGRLEDGKFSEQIIYLSNQCFTKFCNRSTKPMGRMFADKITDFVYEIKKNDLNYKKHNQIVFHEATKTDDLQEVIDKVKKFQQSLGESVHRRNTDPKQMVLDFDEDLYWQGLKNLKNTVNELIMRGFPVKALPEYEPEIQLPTIGQTLRIAQ
jgi:hypothetical protein